MHLVLFITMIIIVIIVVMLIQVGCGRGHRKAMQQYKGLLDSPWALCITLEGGVGGDEAREGGGGSVPVPCTGELSLTSASHLCSVQVPRL